MSQIIPGIVIAKTDVIVEREKARINYLTKVKNSKRIRAAAIAAVIVGTTIFAASKMTTPDDEPEKTEN